MAGWLGKGDRNVQRLGREDPRAFVPSGSGLLGWHALQAHGGKGRDRRGSCIPDLGRYLRVRGWETCDIGMLLQ